MRQKSKKVRILGKVPAGFYVRPRLHLALPDELEVENCKGVLLCNADAIRLNLGKQDALIRGDGLRLLFAQKRLLRIRGQILSVEFSSRGEE